MVDENVAVVLRPAVDSAFLELDLGQEEQMASDVLEMVVEILADIVSHLVQISVDYPLVDLDTLAWVASCLASYQIP